MRKAHHGVLAQRLAGAAGADNVGDEALPFVRPVLLQDLQRWLTQGQPLALHRRHQNRHEGGEANYVWSKEYDKRHEYSGAMTAQHPEYICGAPTCTRIISILLRNIRSARKLRSSEHSLMIRLEM